MLRYVKAHNPHFIVMILLDNLIRPAVPITCRKLYVWRVPIPDHASV
jgi:hypothetical protein